jgi:type I restriction enzyme S subunit
VDFPFIQGADGIKIFKPAFSNEINERFLYQALLYHPIVSQEYKRHFSELKDKLVFCPRNFLEQHRVAEVLFVLDEMIVATNEKLNLLKAYKKGLMQKLFPAQSKTLPEYRFKEFEKEGAWEVKKLGDVTKVVNRRNKSNRDLPIYSISNKDGFIPQSEQFDGLDSNSRGYDTSMYKIVTSNTFAYNPARINVGSIGHSGEIKECLVSSLYVCFKTTDEIDDNFLMYFFNTSSFCQSVDNNVEGGIRSYLFYENFSKIKIMFPSISEQKKIASCLKAVDERINVLSNKVSELGRYKTGMMQKMFPIIK